MKGEIRGWLKSINILFSLCQLYFPCPSQTISVVFPIGSYSSPKSVGSVSLGVNEFCRKDTGKNGQWTPTSNLNSTLSSTTCCLGDVGHAIFLLKPHYSVKYG